MELLGHIQNGVVVLDGNPILPEGTAVTVLLPDPPLPDTRVQLPLVRSNEPGTMQLTNAMIWEILDEDDVAPRR